jgi:hypothetical protein
LWGLVRADQAPVVPLKLGKRLRWPTALVLRAVGLNPEPANDPQPESGPNVVPLRSA